MRFDSHTLPVMVLPGPNPSETATYCAPFGNSCENAREQSIRVSCILCAMRFADAREIREIGALSFAMG